MTARNPVALQPRIKVVEDLTASSSEWLGFWFLKSQGRDLPGSVCEVMSPGLCWGGEKGQASWLFFFTAMWPWVALVPSGERWRTTVLDTKGQCAYYMKIHWKRLAQLTVPPKPSAQDRHKCLLMGLGGLWLPPHLPAVLRIRWAPYGVVQGRPENRGVLGCRCKDTASLTPWATKPGGVSPGNKLRKVTTFVEGC